MSQYGRSVTEMSHFWLYIWNWFIRYKYIININLYDIYISGCENCFLEGKKK